MTDFLIFYEHVNREVENDTLVKYELEKRGYSCEILHFSGPGLYNYHKKKNRAKVVVTPWLRYNCDVLEYLPYAGKPYKLVNLQWEQVYNKRGIECGLVATHDEAKKAYHTCWGENSRARLEDMGVPPENLRVVGAMQQDYGRPLFNDYYLSRSSISEQFHLNNDKPWILFVSSLAYATFPEDALKALATKYGDGIYETADLHKTTQKELLIWVEEFLKRSDSEFIYRPHPSERLCERLTELSDRYPNFHVISEKSVKQWAKVSDRVNLWISTSNAEIASLGIDYSIVRPVPVDEAREVESMRDETFVESMEEFISLNTDILPMDTERIKERQQKLFHFYNYDDAKPAYVRIADYLEEVYLSSNGQSFDFNLKDKVKARFIDFKARMVSKVAERAIRKCDRSIIDRSLFKSHIKKNIHAMLKKHDLKEQAENSMMDYLKSHEQKA